jgi:hypothetical protein
MPDDIVSTLCTELAELASLEGVSMLRRDAGPRDFLGEKMDAVSFEAGTGRGCIKSRIHSGMSLRNISAWFIVWMNTTTSWKVSRYGTRRRTRASSLWRRVGREQWPFTVTRLGALSWKSRSLIGMS